MNGRCIVLQMGVMQGAFGECVCVCCYVLVCVCVCVCVLCVLCVSDKQCVGQCVEKCDDMSWLAGTGVWKC